MADDNSLERLLAQQCGIPAVAAKQLADRIIDVDPSTGTLTSTTAATVRNVAATRQLRTRDKATQSRPALIQAPLWAASTAYVAGDTVRLSTGQLIRCTTAGTSGASAPTFSPLNEITDNTAKWWFTGRYTQSPPENIPVPTVTDSSGVTPLTNTFNPYVDQSKVLQLEAPYGDVISGTGQLALTVAWLYRDSPANDNGGGANGHVAWMRTTRFRTDAQVLDISYLVSTSQDRMQLYIDGYPLWEAPIAPGATGISRYIRVDWSATAGGITRSYQLEGSTNLRQVGLTTGAMVYPDRQDGVIAAVITDSYGTTMVPTSVACHNEYLGISTLRRLGVRYPLMYSLGGTGYIRSSGNRYKVSDFLLNNTLPSNLAFAVMPQSFNDIGISSPAATTATQAATDWRSLRAQLPNTFLIFGGPWPANDAAGTLRVQTDAALEAAFIAMNDPNSGWFSPITGKVILGNGMQVLANDGAWISGTGKQGATTGTGNSDWATSTDGAHPSPTGKSLLELRVGDAVELLLSAAGM